jgi:23S rRNA (uracil1939-C5)-methyltransferase
MGKRRKIRIVEADISSFSKRGNGTGNSLPDGTTPSRPIEVPFAIPGDKVQAQTLRKNGAYTLCSLQQVIQPSPIRIEPRCKHFGVCGGCRWQQIPYLEQLKFKQRYIQEVFEKFNKIKPFELLPILPCEKPWHYRNKMEFSFSSDAAGNKYLGLMMDSSQGKVLNLTECHLVNTWYMDGLQAARRWWESVGVDAYHPGKDAGALRTLTLREGMRTGDRMVILTVSGNPEYALRKSYLESFASYMQEAIEPMVVGSHLSIFLRIQQIRQGMPTNFYEMLLYGPDHIREVLYIQLNPYEDRFSLHFQISPTAFFQPNTYQAERLYSKALQLTNIHKDAVVYDLYCGTGTLGMCLARKVKQVIGIELSPESALDAKMNAARNGLTNITIFSGAVRHVLNTLQNDSNFSKPDLVMVDPPRSGLDPDALKHLHDLSPEKILYLSCNATTQAENLETFIKGGYKIHAMQPVDHFPHTPHIENIVVLAKS